MFSKKTILIIEDDKAIVKMYEFYFQRKGYIVLKAYNGRIGLELLKKLKRLPDLILLDILMPEIDGYEVLKEIKKNNNLKDIPVVFLTNLPLNKKEINEGKKLGAILYLTKSNLTPKQLLEKIKPYLEDKND